MYGDQVILNKYYETKPRNVLNNISKPSKIYFSNIKMVQQNLLI